MNLAMIVWMKDQQCRAWPPMINANIRLGGSNNVVLFSHLKLQVSTSLDHLLWQSVNFVPIPQHLHKSRRRKIDKLKRCVSAATLCVLQFVVVIWKSL
jgi:hypothetical protein